MKYIKLYDYLREVGWTNTAQWMIICGIFMERYYEIAILLFVTLINLCLYRQFQGGVKVVLVMLLVLVSSVISLLVYHYSPGKFIQQYILLFLTLTLYHSFFDLNVGDLKILFQKYLYIAYLVAFLGIIQAIVYYFSSINIFGFLYGRNNFEMVPGILRVTSIIDEPSYLSTLLTPAVAYYILSGENFGRKYFFRQLVLYICVFLTFSTITYFVITLLFFYKYLVYKRYFVAKVVAASFVVLCISGLAYLASTENSSDRGLFSDISLKLRETTSAMIEMDVDSFDDLNMSSYATMTNFWVALNAPGRLLGTGLGTHEQNYYSTYFSTSPFYGVNAPEGYSLFNRIFSEFGLVGLFILIFLLFSCYNRNNIINITVLFIVLTLLIRGGHYTRYGTIFFFFLFYYSSDIVQKVRARLVTK